MVLEYESLSFSLPFKYSRPAHPEANSYFILLNLFLGFKTVLCDLDTWLRKFFSRTCVRQAAIPTRTMCVYNLAEGEKKS